jgi:hypothetical protein
VAVVANNRTQSRQASEDCVISCVGRLQQLIENDKLVIDARGLILSEYQSRIVSGQQPGVGYAFLKWLYINQWAPQRCDRVQITPVSDDPFTFSEFPHDPHLADFDREDRKFVAVALVHAGRPPILNAVDTDWLIFREPLERNGLRLEFICEDDLRAIAQRRRI